MEQHHRRGRLHNGWIGAVLLFFCACNFGARTAAEPLPHPSLPVASPEARSATAPTPAIPSESGASNKMGIHLLLDDGRNQWPEAQWEAHLRAARAIAGAGGYVTELVRADDLDPVRWQRFFDLCRELELRPILRLATTFDRSAGWWAVPVPDPDGGYRTAAQAYADFLAALNWPGSAHYVIVGNEPNHGNEWGGRPDPAAYARFLIDVAAALRAVDPQVKVLNAGLDPYTPHTGSRPFSDGLYYMDEESFMDGMDAAYPGVFTVLDCWCSHAYPPGPFSEPPWVQTYQVDWINDAANPHHVTPTVGIYNRGINGYEWELFKLATYGVTALPVMITETGWRHPETTDPEATDSVGATVEGATLDAYLDLALRGNGGRYPQYPETGWTPWLQDPRVMAVTPFALDGNPAEWGHTNWLELDAQGNILGIYPFGNP